jgi:hypothetical protein
MDLSVRIQWQSFDALRAKLPPCAGLWFIGTPYRIVYPKGRSRIVAANMSADLRSDLRSAFRQPERCGDLLRAVLTDADGPVVSLLALPTLSAPAVEAVSLAVLECFVARHGVLPFANAATAVGAADAAWEGGLELVEKREGRMRALDADAIGARYGLDWSEDALPPLGLAFALGESDEAVGDIEVSRVDSGIAWRSIRFARRTP